MMVVKDTRMARKLFFGTFLIYRAVLLVFFAYNVYRDIVHEPLANEQAAVATVCDMFKNSPGGFEEAGYASYADCEQRTLKLMTVTNCITLALANMMFLHFVLVAYTHLQNSDLPVALGGCPKTANETDASELTITNPTDRSV